MKINKQKLCLAMANACINDRELCERSGVAQATLSQVKAGRRSPKPITIGKLARALDIRVEELTEGGQ